MIEKAVCQEFRFKNIDRGRNYFIEEINQNDLMSKSKKYKQIFTALSFIKHVLILASVVTGCASVSAFSSLVAKSISKSIPSSEVEWKMCAINSGIKKHKLITKEKGRSMIK